MEIIRVGSIIHDKEDGDTARITRVNYNYVWYEMLTGEFTGQTMCTRTERMPDEWRIDG
jgi:hypothetical protein